jgi:septum formation protein
MNFPSIYLASGSPRRRELLSQIGVDFSILSLQVDETRLIDETPSEYVVRVATSKAQAGWDSVDDDNKKPVLGSDTSVVIDNDVLGKPKNNADAKAMLQRLSASQHKVITAVVLVDGDKILSALSVNHVQFAELTAADIDWYVNTQEGVDKAGGYAIQGLA